MIFVGFLLSCPLLLSFAHVPDFFSECNKSRVKCLGEWMIENAMVMTVLPESLIVCSRSPIQSSHWQFIDEFDIRILHPKPCTHSLKWVPWLLRFCQFVCFACMKPRTPFLFIKRSLFIPQFLICFVILILYNLVILIAFRNSLKFCHKQRFLYPWKPYLIPAHNPINYVSAPAAYAGTNACLQLDITNALFKSHERSQVRHTFHPIPSFHYDGMPWVALEILIQGLRIGGPRLTSPRWATVLVLRFLCPSKHQVLFPM